MFEKKGLFLIPADKADEDKLMEIALEAGADDVRRSGDKFEVICAPTSTTPSVQGPGRRRHPARGRARSRRIPKNTVDVSDPDTARKVLKLMKRLDDHDDVQNVSSNFNIPDEIMAQVGSE